jgi:hypothetical protein
MTPNSCGGFRVMRGAPLLFAMGAMLAVRAQAQQNMFVSGTVVSAVSNEGLAYSTISISGGMQRFSGSDGFFSFQLSPGRYSFRVRQLGYSPLDTVVTVPATEDVRALVFALQPVALRMETLRIYSKSCKSYDQHSEIAQLLDELTKNADREKLLRTEYPFVYQIERRNAFRGIGGLSQQTADTVKYFSKVVGGYVPGKLVQPLDPLAPKATQEMRVPTLVDLADPKFIDSHCFRFRGVEDVADARAYRIDFEPAGDMNSADVEGSAYIDSATYMIRKAVFRLTRPEKLRPQIIGLEVTTTYREIFRGLAMFQQIHSEQPLDRRARFDSFQLQDQKLIGILFYGRTPEDVEIAVAQGQADPPIDSTARLAGTVVDSAERRLPRAEILTADGGARTATTESGQFLLPGLKPGKTSFVVRAVGFAPATFTSDLRATRTRNVRVILNRVTVQLSTIVVEDDFNDPMLSFSGFYDRKKGGFGTFITPEEIQSRDEAHISDLLRGVRGIDVQPATRWGTVPYSTRSPGSRDTRCLMNVFVDGVTVQVTRDFPIETAIQGSELGAIEIYPGPSETPAKFLGASNGCGSIVIWSKGFLRNAPRRHSEPPKK